MALGVVMSVFGMFCFCKYYSQPSIGKLDSGSKSNTSYGQKTSRARQRNLN